MESSHLEIERKFIAEEVPFDLATCRSLEMRQGYLVVDPERRLSVRVRQEGDRYRLAIKQGGGAVRTEVELPMEVDQFNALWPLARARSLEKRRYIVDDGARRIEIDVFSGSLSPLILVEVEFESEEEAHAFTPPAWFGREVTDDARYLNQNLADAGRPPVDR